MNKPNMNYADLKDSYLFFRIAQKVKKFSETHPDKKILRLGIGDVTLPLCKAVIRALKSAVKEQSKKSTFHGYTSECGAPFLRKTIGGFYRERGVNISDDEVFVSSGASDELGDILDLFDKENSALVIEPAYPAYVDANVIAGRKIIRLPSSAKDGFAPFPDKNTVADIIYICSPNNPTGAVFNKEKLKAWVDFANEHGSVILFDAAYESFVEDEGVPHSIFEIDGALTCAIEICSLSKTAGFTGTRLGYTVIPKKLKRADMSFNDMWVRNRTTKTNGVSYIIQKGGAAVFSERGQKQIKKNIDYYKQNAKILTEVLDECGIEYTGGVNAPYIWLKCPFNLGSWEFFDLLLEKVQVVGTPGEGFGSSGEGFFRFSTFGSREDTIEAASRLKGLLKLK